MFLGRQKKPELKPYRVLCIDGGGMRGLYTALLLETLEARFAQQRGVKALDIGKAFDLIIGTSTGAIIAIMLMLGVSTREIVHLYRELGPKIFQDPVPNGYNNNGHFSALWRWVWRNWRKPANSTTPLREGILPLLGDITLGEAYEERKIALCIPVVNMSNHRGTLFRTPHDPHKRRDANYKLIDACIASISAPILFPLTTIDDPDDPEDYKTFIDGGLWANNPTLVGMREALLMTDNERPIEILSLSTCDSPRGTFIAKTHTDWGLSEWRAGTRVLSLALEAQSSAYYEIAKTLAKYLKQSCKVIRLPQSAPSAEQEKHIVMDQASPYTLKVLSDLAKQDAEAAYRLSLDPDDTEFSVLSAIFAAMPAVELVD